ncbi:MAG: DUF6132 family protein [Chloroherpetonaceae bacterium]|nr:DUF6132 family protein [Chloroherpetonaceae bacterium]
MFTFAMKYWKLIGFSLLGASACFACYYFIGCVSGTCPITSDPFISTGYGATMGALFGWESKTIQS